MRHTDRTHSTALEYIAMTIAQVCTMRSQGSLLCVFCTFEALIRELATTDVARMQGL